MQRTKFIDTNQQMQSYVSQIANRARLAARLGQQYDGDRDLYQALGYKKVLEYADFEAQYSRQDIAKAIIDRPVKATWRGKLKIEESDVEEDTNFEQAWNALDKKLKLISIFSRVDRLAGIGRYAVLFLGLDDAKTEGDFEKPVTVGTRKLLYIKPYDEGSVEILTFDTNAKSERFGLPLIYGVKMTMEDGKTSQDFRVHYSRIVHIVDDVLDSEIYGIPSLEPVFNRLQDLEKIVGGDGEMFWRGARPGYQGVTDPDFQVTPESKADAKDQIDEFEHNLRRIIISEGYELKALAQEISDPKSHVDVQLQMISAEKGIPKRILVGSERGELASSQDSDEWKEYVQTRREEHAEPHIIQPFIDVCLKYKILPTPQSGDYSILWKDLFTKSEKEKTEIGKNRATAIREYMTSPMVSMIFPPKAFMEFCMGLDDDQIARVMKLSEEEVQGMFKEFQDAQLEAATNPEPQPTNTQPTE